MSRIFCFPGRVSDVLIDDHEIGQLPRRLDGAFTSNVRYASFIVISRKATPRLIFCPGPIVKTIHAVREKYKQKDRKAHAKYRNHGDEQIN